MKCSRFVLTLLCAALPLAQAVAAAPNRSAAGYILQGVPLVRQTYNACGPASLTEVLAYFGINMTLEEVSRLTRPDERSYMSAQAIVNFAPTAGMQARLYAGGNLQTVRQAIKNGLPLIALQAHVPQAGVVIPHWRVIVGYDDAQRQVYLMDPLLGYVGMDYDDFSRVWANQRGQFAVMFPPALGKKVSQVIG